MNIKKISRKGHFLFVLMSIFFSYSSFAQSIDKQKLFDSLIVNKWKTEKVKVGNEFLKLDKDQLESSLVILNDHTAQNFSNGREESGKWELDAANMKLTIGFGHLLKIKPIVLNIIILEKNKFVFSVSDEESENVTTFECIADQN